MAKIKHDKFYTPKEMITFVPSKASTDDVKRQMILRHIGEGKINAVNLGGEKKPRYVIQGKNVQEYLDTHISPGEYNKK